MINRNELLYAYTIIDPLTYTAPVVAGVSTLTECRLGNVYMNLLCREGNRAVAGHK